MTSSDAELVSHITLAAARLAEIVEGGREAFDENWSVRAAAERQLEIIGEAAGKLSPKLVAERADLPLGKARAMRNFIAHDYDDIDYQLVWDTIESDVPDLARSLALLFSGPQHSDAPGP